MPEQKSIAKIAQEFDIALDMLARGAKQQISDAVFRSIPINEQRENRKAYRAKVNEQLARLNSSLAKHMVLPNS